jgi:hypothetical protein
MIPYRKMMKFNKESRRVNLFSGFYFYLILLIISAAAKPRMLPVTRPVTDNTGR